MMMKLWRLNISDYPLYGMQFHPESIGTEAGSQLLKQFLIEMREEVAI